MFGREKRLISGWWQHNGNIQPFLKLQICVYESHVEDNKEKKVVYIEQSTRKVSGRKKNEIDLFNPSF